MPLHRQTSRPSDERGSHPILTKYLDVASPIFSTPDLTIFCRLDSLDLFCIGQHITATNAVLEPYVSGWSGTTVTEQISPTT
ncbi:hypothetical protein CIK61_17870 [Brevibacterium aurantiacum]|nr:hypothetical protein CIK61_17870 [Brevibacterium aurantiacum]